MARLRTRVERAAVLHRQAAAALTATAKAIDGYSPSSSPAEQYAEQHDLAAQLRSAAADLVPGWLGSGVEAVSAATSVGGTGVPAFLRLGMAHPLDDAAFPAIAPLFGTGHLAVDADARDPRVAGLLRTVLLRLVAAAVPGAMRIRVIDGAGDGDTVASFAGLPNLNEPVADHIGMRNVLAEADKWIHARSAAAASASTPSASAASAAADGGPEQFFVLVIASLPELTDGTDLTHIAHLARVGVASQLHLVVAGWPPPPLTAETTQPPLPHSTQISLRNPYVWMGDPPGATYAANGVGPARLNAPVYLDPDPPVDIIRRVCGELAAAAPDSVSPPAWSPSPARWQEYVTAAQRLDSVRREAAKLVIDQTAAVKRVRADLVAVRRQLAIQQNRITEMVRDGRPVPLRPVQTDMGTADAALSRLAQAASERAATTRLAARTASPATTAPPTTTAPPATEANPTTAPTPATATTAGGDGGGGGGPARSGPPKDATGPAPAGGMPAPQSTRPAGQPEPHPTKPGPAGRAPTSGVPVSGRPAGSRLSPVEVTSPPRPTSGPGHRPVSGPGREPVSGQPTDTRLPQILYGNTNSFPTVSAPPRLGPLPPITGPVVTASPLATGVLAPGGPPSTYPRLPEAAMTMLAEARANLRRADAELSNVDARINRSPALRNGLVYAAYGVLFALVQVPLLIMMLVQDAAPVIVLPCGLILVPISFLLGWITIGVAYRRPSGRQPRRTSVLGFAISLVVLVPGLLSTAWMILDALT